MPIIPSHRKKHIPMKKITALFFAACIIVGVGCHWVGVRGNGHLKTDQRTISAFATVDASGAFTIEWRNGAPALSITTDENLLPYIDNQVSGDTLHLHTRENIWPTHGIKVVISSPTRTGQRLAARLSSLRIKFPGRDSLWNRPEHQRSNSMETLTNSLPISRAPAN